MKTLIYRMINKEKQDIILYKFRHLSYFWNFLLKGKPELFHYIDRNTCEKQSLSSLNMSQLKKHRLLDKKLYSILKEIFIFIAFLIFMFSVAFSNQSKFSFQYKQLFIGTFVESQNLQEKGLADVSFCFSKIIFS